ncbi:MAG TPA: ABC transporter permease [Acetobacteraceae bacterium]|nr:ABC transporter permease [Acetobacteraceae bacterium]
MSGLTRERETALAGIVIALVLLIGFRAPVFLTPGSLRGVFSDTSALVILALGEMVVILTGAIDLSIAANLALTGMLTAMLSVVAPGVPGIAFLLLAALLGLVLGALNGALVWRVGIPSIVVTLGTLSIYRGLIFPLRGGAWVNSNEMSHAFLNFPRITFGMDLFSWVAVAVGAAVWFVLAHTRFGRKFYAAGGNPRAAVYAGIDPGREQFLAFCISGTLAGLCGYLWVSRYAVAYVDTALGFELQVIAACVIGGVSIAGGIGTVTGCVLGALFLGVVKNALPTIGVSPFWQMGISGVVIVVAVILNARGERRHGRRILRPAGTI